MYSRKGETSHRLDSALSRIRDADHEIRAWESLSTELASPDAKDSAFDTLRGLVVGVKDVIDVAGLPTKAGSKAFAQAAPAKADAPVVARLRNAGTVILGKTKTTEFAYTDPTDTANPANLDHTPGGSSSGSAAAVAAGMADLALGTQTVGSVCRPAAYCGVTAFKPSTSSTNSAGVTPLARSFDTVGFLAKEISIAVDAFACSAGIAPISQARSAFLPLRVGMMMDPFYLNCDPSVAEAVDTARKALEQIGATIVEIKGGISYESMRENHRVLMFKEAHAVHGHLLDRPELLGPNWCTALEKGRAISETTYWEARDRLSDAKAALASACDSADILLLPPAPSTAPKGLHSTGDAGFILPWTVFGGPLAVIPVGRAADGLPTAAMISGKPWTDVRTGQVAIRLQSALNS
jgi:Asp-tRNA(Asn)/Glu-tRNA(Gln) amidotransferase A subunit family amidase